MNYTITSHLISSFRQHLLEAEKAPATIEKYIRDVAAFSKFTGNAEVTKKTLIAYKEMLLKKYKPASINSMLAALNHFFAYCGW